MCDASGAEAAGVGGPGRLEGPGGPGLPHEELLELTAESTAALLGQDALLADLPSDVILEEVQAQIAVEHGRSITIFISRESEPTLNVIVPQNVTINALKKAIARHFQIYQKRINSKVKISWKYIWKVNELSYDGLLLDNDNTNIADYGVCNKTTLTFKRKLKKMHKF